MAFSPDGKMLASGNYKTAILWDVANGTDRFTLKGHISQVGSLQFSPDGRQLVTRSIAVKLWNVKTGETIWSREQPKHFFNDVCFSKEGKALFSDGPEGKLWEWDAATGRPSVSYDWGMGQGEIQKLAMAPDGSQLAIVNSNGSLSLVPIPEQ